MKSTITITTILAALSLSLVACKSETKKMSEEELSKQFAKARSSLNANNIEITSKPKTKTTSKPTGEFARAEELSQFNSDYTTSMRFPEKVFSKEVKYIESKLGSSVKISDTEYVWPAMKSATKCTYFYIKNKDGAQHNGMSSFAKGFAGYDKCLGYLNK